MLLQGRGLQLEKACCTFLTSEANYGMFSTCSLCASSNSENSV